MWRATGGSRGTRGQKVAQRTSRLWFVPGPFEYRPMFSTWGFLSSWPRRWPLASPLQFSRIDAGNPAVYSCTDRRVPPTWSILTSIEKLKKVPNEAEIAVIHRKPDTPCAAVRGHVSDVVSPGATISVVSK